MAADSSILALQQIINRFAPVGRFAPVATDGVFGSNTRLGVVRSLEWIIQAQGADPSFREAAQQHLMSWDQQPGAYLAFIALFLGNVANGLSLPGAAPGTVKPPTATSSGVPITPTVTSPVPYLPPPPDTGMTANISETWRRIPTWGKVIGGMLVGLGLLWGITKATRRDKSPAM